MSADRDARCPRDHRDERPPRLFRVILPVSDIAGATAFYSRLLGQAGERIGSGRHYFFCGGAILVCFDPRAEGDDFDALPNNGHVFFAVDDLHGYFKRARVAGCKWLDKEPKKRGWGELSFYARDPFNNPICFVDETTLYEGDDSHPH